MGRRGRMSGKNQRSARTMQNELKEKAAMNRSPYFGEDEESTGQAPTKRQTRASRKRPHPDSSDNLLNSTEPEGLAKRQFSSSRHTSRERHDQDDEAEEHAVFAPTSGLHGKARRRLQRLTPAKRKAPALDKERDTAVKRIGVQGTAMSNDKQEDDGFLGGGLERVDCVASSKQGSDQESDSDGEWEDVPVGGNNEVEMLEEAVASQLVKKKATAKSSILVDVRVDESKRSRKTKSELERLLDKFAREVHQQKCKVHLLCLMANGFYENSFCCHSLLQAVALSRVPSDLLSKLTVNPVNRSAIQQVLDWYFKTFSIEAQQKEQNGEQKAGQLAGLVIAFQNGEFPTTNHYIKGLVAVLRALQILTRFIFSLQPMALKPNSTPVKSKASSSSPKSAGDPRDGSDDSPLPAPASSTVASQKRCRKRKSSAAAVSESPSNADKDDVIFHKLARTKRRARRREKPEGKVDKTPVPPSSNPSSEPCRSAEEPTSEVSSTSGSISSPGEPRRSARLRNDRRVSDALHKSVAEINDESSSSDSKEDEDPLSPRGTQHIDVRHLESSSDSDFEISSGKVKHFRSPVVPNRPQTQTKRTLASAAAALKRKMSSLSTPQGTGSAAALVTAERRSSQICRRRKSGEGGTDHWLEVYISAEEQWACIDVEERSFVSTLSLTEKATWPVSYVMAFDGDGRVKDVTQRYVSDWMTRAQKRRINSSWWRQTLAPYTPLNQEIDIEEDLRLQVDLEAQPFPVSIADFKNHPLYALKRHLLKFEAIYPEDAPILGFIKGEAIYPRSCVKTMHTRETWLKDGLVVKEGEKPYKVVKARPKRSTPAHERDKLLADTFGEWQTEVYIPPTAKDGKVPRNQYGNVELFKPSMLPGGTCHMQVPGLQRVARKLGIDYAEAMVGWDQHSGYSHPVFDGIVVCEEFADTLLDAFEQDRAEEERKRQEKREKRAISNWYKLTKGLLIRQRVRRQFSLQDGGSCEEEEHPHEDEVEEVSGLAPDSEMTLAWPNNRKDGIVSADADGHCHVFAREHWQADITSATGWTKKCTCGLVEPVKDVELTRAGLKIDNSCTSE